MIKGKLLTIIASIVSSLTLVVGIAYVTFTKSDLAENPESPNYSYEPIDSANAESPSSIFDESKIEEQFNETNFEEANREGELAMSPWYALTEETGEVKKKETKYGSESAGFLNFVMGKVKSIPKATPAPPVTDTSSSNDSNDSNDTSYNLGSAPSLNTDFNWSNITGSDNSGNNSNNNSGNNSGTNSGTPIYPQEESITVTTNTEHTNKDGNVSASATDNPNFNIYDYVPKATKVISGNSLTEKLFDELDALNEMFVVKLEKDRTIDSVLDSIVSNYKGQLLVDNLKYGKVAKDNDSHYKLEVTYHITATQKTQLTNWAKSLFKNTALTEKEQVTLINDKVKALGDYSEKGANIYSPYSLYKQGKGVCQAYASLTKFALDVAGIENGIATGLLDGVPHAWNVVYIDGKEYHVDVTNNDVTSSSKYLLVSAEQIGKTHVVDKIIN